LSQPAPDLVITTPQGLYCPKGQFHIDPWQPVEHAIITHAHSDHLRAGSGTYIVSTEAEALARHRLPLGTAIKSVPYGDAFESGSVRVSLHPAGHVRGSAQVRIESNESAGESIWVVSGDYKRDADPTCAPFEPVACDVFISEATFALPIYRWEPAAVVAREIHEWWLVNRRQGNASVLFAYALGKAQRVLAELAALTPERIFLHGAVASLTQVYRDAGVLLPPTELATSERRRDYAGELIIAPPGAAGSPWMRRFGSARTGFCSGWMRVRGNRRRRGYDRGFVLSDHADWPSLLRTIGETRASRILLTHGHADTLCRYLSESGMAASVLATQYEGDA
jgi:putative mRNA 3-end processing factor